MKVIDHEGAPGDARILRFPSRSEVSQLCWGEWTAKISNIVSFIENARARPSQTKVTRKNRWYEREGRGTCRTLNSQARTHISEMPQTWTHKRALPAKPPLSVDSKMTHIGGCWPALSSELASPQIFDEPRQDKNVCVCVCACLALRWMRAALQPPSDTGLRQWSWQGRSPSWFGEVIGKRSPHCPQLPPSGLSYFWAQRWCTFWCEDPAPMIRGKRRRDLIEDKVGIVEFLCCDADFCF